MPAVDHACHDRVWRGRVTYLTLPRCRIALCHLGLCLDACFGLVCGDGGQRPDQHLDCHAGDQQAELGLIGSLEHRPDGVARPVIERTLRQFNLDLVTLADIAGIAVAGDRQTRARGGKPHNRCRLSLHIGEQCRQRAAIQIIEPDILASDNLIGHRRQKKADSRSHTGIGRHDDPFDSQFCGQSSGV